VQQRRGQDLGVGDARLVGQQAGEGERVVDVGGGLGVLAALVAVLVRCQQPA
jgi:ubiquinone/menaquinone biosynthesis C-methylase UbiE